MEDSTSKFIEFTSEETGNALLTSEGEYISLLTIDIEKVPEGFPNFNSPHGKIKLLIKEEDLKNQNYKNIKFYQEN